MNKKSNSNFSVALGLFDYINPILYSITTFLIIKYMNNIFLKPYLIIYIIGAFISLIFGLTIPTIKLLVGLGKMKFKMPVNLVFYVNSGIFISGLMLLKTIFNINIILLITMFLLSIILLCLIYNKTKKFNTIAVLIGSIGYIFIYISMISLALKFNMIGSFILYLLAIILFILLCLIGIFSDLKNSKVHWTIEISNVLCQFSVMLGTLILLV